MTREKSENKFFYKIFKFWLFEAKNMDDLFKIDKIDGKGFGWIALRDIKPGTLIYKEKPQFTVCDDRPNPLDLMNSFYAMSENDQKEFLELRNKYLDLKSLPDRSQQLYLDWKKVAEIFVRKRQAKGQVPIDSNLVLKIKCIFQTNFFKIEDGSNEVGIKVSRLSHSCIPNSHKYEEVGEMGKVTIRATEKILKGQEITISYSTNDIAMINVKERQKFCHEFGFICTCELCQEEEIKNNDEIYEKFRNLKEETENAYANFGDSKNLDQLEKALAGQKQMYNLARNKKAEKPFMIDLLVTSVNYALIGYIGATLQDNYGKRDYFKEEFVKLSKVGYQISKLAFGKDTPVTKDWKERNEDFDNWFQLQQR